MDNYRCPTCKHLVYLEVDYAYPVMDMHPPLYAVKGVCSNGHEPEQVTGGMMHLSEINEHNRQVAAQNE